MLIMGIDIGKKNSVWCNYETLTTKTLFGAVTTKPQNIHDLIVTHQPQRIVIEACSLCGWVCDIANALNIKIEVANTTHQAWRWKHVKKKTDRNDALKLAQLSSLNQIPKVYVPSPSTRQLRSLITYRQALVKRRTQIKNSIRAIFDRQGIQIPYGKTTWSKKGLELLKSYAKPFTRIADAESLWKGQLHIELYQLGEIEIAIEKVESKLEVLASANPAVKLLMTIPGVGPRLAEIIVAFIDNPHRFENCKQVGAYAGLSPRRYQSGDFDRQGSIDKQGNKILRSMLIEVSWICLRYNKWAKDIFNQIERGSKSRRKIAITAVARKLLITCWAMLRDNTAWLQKKYKMAA